MTPGSSLNEVAKLLKDALGDAAPARITLHRHSANGDLDAFVVRRSSSRRYFDATRMIEHYRGREPVQQKPVSAPVQKMDEDLARQLAEEMVRQALPLIEQRIAKALDPLSTLMTNVARQIGELVAVRQSLMLKYDAAASLGQQRLERAESDLKTARAGGTTVEQQVSKIAIEISRVRDALSLLTQRQG